jgi:hypothetical protein
LSHSSVINPWNTPWIISETSWLKQDFNIYSEIELEKDKSINWFESENNLYNILRENLKNIQELEAKLDKIGYLDWYNILLVIKKKKKDIKLKINKLIN